MARELEGKVAVVTGAASGIGLASSVLGSAFSDAMGIRLCVLEMGDQLFLSNSAPAGVQARHSRRLDLARAGYHGAPRMLTRPRGMTIRDVVMLPTNFDL